MCCVQYGKPFGPLIVFALLLEHQKLMIIILNKYFFFFSHSYTICRLHAAALLQQNCCLYCRVLKITVSVVRQNVVCSTVLDITVCPVKPKPHTVDTLCFRATEDQSCSGAFVSHKLLWFHPLSHFQAFQSLRSNPTCV